MSTLRRSAYLNPQKIPRVNKLLKELDYPPIKEGYVSNIIAGFGPDEQEVYEIISHALGYDLIDGSGYSYIPEFLKNLA